MAHEINNPLMVIKGNVQLIVRDGAISDPVSRERMDAVLGGVDAIHRVVQRMHRIIELKVATEK